MVSSNRFNQHLRQNIPFRENYTYESEFPDIKPPVTTTTHTKFGECLVIAGTESLYPLEVRTTANANPTAVGTLLASIPINPQLLTGTRLSKIAENYTFWYPKELVVEYVPLGSALDRGSLISVPTLDPSDTFLISTTDPNSVVRRALSYERSVSFNIYDKPQFLLPPSEEDDLFYITPGQNARQEISHVWNCIAQTSYSPVASETTRVLGWFKLHYVIELYTPRLLQSVTLPEISENSTVSTLTLHGTVTTGDLVVINEDYCTNSLQNGYPTYPIWQLSIASYVPDTDPSIWRVGDTVIEVGSNMTFYLRHVPDNVSPSTMLVYSNLSDCINNTNPFVWDYSQSSTGIDIIWTSVALNVVV